MGIYIFSRNIWGNSSISWISYIRWSMQRTLASIMIVLSWDIGRIRSINIRLCRSWREICTIICILISNIYGLEIVGIIIGWQTLGHMSWRLIILRGHVHRHFISVSFNETIYFILNHKTTQIHTNYSIIQIKNHIWIF